jgi:hypothetical protein
MLEGGHPWQQFPFSALFDPVFEAPAVDLLLVVLAGAFV